MGTRGPKPMPAALQLMRGNPGRRPINLSDGVNPEVSIPSPPDWLGPHALKEWRRIGEELAKLGLIAEIDKASLATYCQTWDNLVTLEKAFAAQMHLQAEKLAHVQGPAKEMATAMSAFFYKTDTGFHREHPIHKKIVELRSELDKYLRNFGLNPSARSRVTASNNQPSLPGLELENTPPTGWAKFAH